MTIRCKYVCHSVRKFKHWDRSKGFLYEAEFNAVTDGSEENKAFYEATPSGALKVATYKDDHFMPGQAYYIDITPAEG